MSVESGDLIQMNAMADIEAVHRFARTLEDAEAKRLGVCLPVARESLARRLRTSPGTLENIRRLRTKIVPAWLMARIRAELISVLQNEITKLEHEIHLIHQTGADYRNDDLAAAVSQVAEARKVLEAAK